MKYISDSTATILERCLAITLDAVLLGLPMICLTPFLFAQLGLSTDFISTGYIFIILSYAFFYEPLCHTYFSQTLGQRLMSLQVKRLDGSNISLIEAYLRLFLKYLLGIINFVPVVLGKDRTLHDFASQSVVINNKRVP